MTQRHTPPRRSAFAALAIGLSLAAGPASAEGWSIFKLESLDSVEACMAKARTVISRYMFDIGGAETGADSWSVYGYDLEPGAQDAVIICPEGPDGVVDALLVVQSESESAEREQAAEGLSDIWDSE